MSVAAGSGRIHDGLKFCIVLRLGTTDDFKPDGANMIKLCANTGFHAGFQSVQLLYE